MQSFTSIQTDANLEIMTIAALIPAFDCTVKYNPLVKLSIAFTSHFYKLVLHNFTCPAYRFFVIMSSIVFLIHSGLLSLILNLY